MSDYGNLPVDLVFVRHGESEGNLAEELSWKGDESHYEFPPFKAKHTSRYRLTQAGRHHAKAAGDWLKANMPMGGRFDSYYCSEYIRARETAAYLDLPAANWHVEFYLRERDQGYLSGTSQQERARNSQIQYELSRRDMDWFYWAPAGGESISDCCLRCDRVMSHLSQTCQGLRVLIVSHGNIMVAFRIRLERMEQRKMRNIMDDPDEKLYNGHILHYSRRDPETGEVHPHINWVRSICPWDTSKTDMSWRKIRPATYSNDELLATVHEVPQVIERLGVEIPPEVNMPIQVPTDPKEKKEKKKDVHRTGSTELSRISRILGFPNSASASLGGVASPMRDGSAANPGTPSSQDSRAAPFLSPIPEDKAVQAGVKGSEHGATGVHHQQSTLSLLPASVSPPASSIAPSSSTSTFIPISTSSSPHSATDSPQKPRTTKNTYE